MTAIPTDEQIAIRDAARDYLRDNADFERLRRTIDTGSRIDCALWQGFAVELGFAGIGIAEAHGGAGLGALEQALILEELGRVLAPIPWFESAVLGADLIARAGNQAQRDLLLPGIASGTTIATLAARDASGGPLPQAIGPVLDGGRLTGSAHYVPFGDCANLLIIAARAGDGIALIALSADMPGIVTTAQTALDTTRPLARIDFDIDVPDEAILDAAAFEPALARAAGLLASEQLGVAERSLAETVAYAGERVQFGRRIGSFQAVKHRLADMKLAVDEARSAAAWAAGAIAGGEDHALAAAGARVRCTEAALHCTADAIQLHGGIGFTWEHHAHLFFKRARATATLLDPPAVHRERIAARLFSPHETDR